MRRSLILTVAAVVTMVLLAMLVPMAVLLRSYALEDRLSRAALEVQATETVVSSAGTDKGPVALYLDRVRDDDDGIEVTVVYPDGSMVGIAAGTTLSTREQRRIVIARNTGAARVDDIDGGSVILVPVSLGGSSAAGNDTPVVRILVRSPGLDPDLVRSWLVLLALGLVLLGGALLLADRLSRSFVVPIRRLAEYAGELGRGHRPDPVPAAGPPEVRELGRTFTELVDRVDVLLERERASIADISHRLRTPMTSLRLRIDALPDAGDRARLGADLDDLQAMVDHVVREARRSEREGLVPATDAVSVLGDRARFWAPLAEDLGRPFTIDDTTTGPVRVRAAAEDLAAVLDVLLDNAFTHTPDDAAVRVALAPHEDGGVRVVVEDAGPGLPAGRGLSDLLARGSSGAGSTGLGLSIAEKTATESGGGLLVEPSAMGGLRVVVDLGGAG